jgi:hypothetical protein
MLSCTSGVVVCLRQVMLGYVDAMTKPHSDAKRIKSDLMPVMPHAGGASGISSVVLVAGKLLRERYTFLCRLLISERLCRGLTLFLRLGNCHIEGSKK